jgi:glycosyltransferase involved in cell wall biosynthesis
LLVLGDGPERKSLEKLARRLRIQHRVRFHGWTPRDQVFARLAKAAAVVFPGLREEGGLSLAEAMLFGAPVIVLANGGARTIAAAATDRFRVALIEPGTVTTTVQRMAEAMTYFSRHADMHARGPLLDQTAARDTLRAAFEHAIADRVGWVV